MKWLKIMMFMHVIIPLFVVCLVFMMILPGNAKEQNPKYRPGGVLSDEVLQYEALIYKYAELHYIPEYARYLIAIMQVETGGQGVDVMQSLALSGIPEEEWTAELSIDYACAYFATLYWTGKSKECDIDTVIQAYNYGGGYIDYVARNGKEHSFMLASSFAAAKSSGKKVAYNNEIAVRTNGGWRYEYGNMFYVFLVKQYLAANPLPGDVAGSVLQEALKYKGWKYVWGGASPATSFDCSGLVQYCYGVCGIALPRTAQEQFDATTHLTLGEAQPGDLVFFTKTNPNSPNYITHVGIYAGDGKMYHAGDPIGYSDLSSQYWRAHLVCAGRIGGNEQ